MKNEERGQEGASCLSRVSVALSETTVTLLKGRHTLVRPPSTQPHAAAALAYPPSSSRASVCSRRAHEHGVGLWESAGGSSLTPGSLSHLLPRPPPSPPSRLGVSESPSRPYLLKVSS